MLYYQPIAEKYDYFTGYTTIENELLTEKEKNRRFPHIYDCFFRPVIVSRNKTYFMFGARFAMSDSDIIFPETSTKSKPGLLETIAPKPTKCSIAENVVTLDDSRN